MNTNAPRFTFNRRTRFLVLIAAVVLVVSAFGATAYMQTRKQQLDVPVARPAEPVSVKAPRRVVGNREEAPVRAEASGRTEAAEGTLAEENVIPHSPTVVGTCDTAGPIEVESTAGTVANVPTPYATLTLAFTAINGGTLHTGTIKIDVCGDTTETASAGLNQVTGVTSITIAPAGGAARTISGAIAAGSPLINLNGADNVTIDGLNTGGNSLTLSNTTVGTTTGTSTIRFIADASNNTVTNCSILGSSTSTLATVAGTIVFSTGTTTGNDNNTISNNNIGPAGANLPSKAIMASGTSSTIENDNAMITGNNIFDFFLPGSSLSGINILTGNEAWTISNNKFYQTATRTFTTTALRYAAITLSNSTGGFTVSGNTIGFGAANGTGTTTITGSSNEFRGIDAASVRTTAPATEIQNNTISGINQTSSRASTTTASSAFIAVAMGTTDGLINATGNTIGSLDGASTIVLNHTSTTAGTAPVIGFYNFSFFATNISNNNIGAITIQSTGTTTGFRGILVNTTTALPATINNNTIGGTNAAGAITDTQVGSYALYGIQSSLPNLTATGNTIRNMSGASNGASLIISAGILASGSTGNNTISQNTIHSLSNASGAAANSIYGLSLSLPATTNLVERNLIHSFSLTSTVTGTQLWGISSGATGTATYQNNMIRLGIDAAGNSVTLPTSIIGIRDAAGATNQFYHNTIYIGGTGVLATPTAANSYCFFSDVVTVTRNYQDNIFWNARGNAVAGGVAHIAIRVGGTAANPPGLTSNYNDLHFSGTDGATGVFNATVVPTLAAWRTTTGQDANSFAGDPNFIAPNGTSSTVNLHVQSNTPVESHGLAIATVLDDFDGQTRSALTPTDIGADAGNFVSSVIQFISATYSINENDGTGLAIITLSRTQTVGAVSVTAATVAGGTATAGSDYTTTSTSVAFADGVPNASFTIPISDDSVFEGNETVFLALSSPTSGATLGTPNTATLTIIDNDAAPTFSVDDVTHNEGDSGTTAYTFTITKTGATALNASVSYETVNGTAIAPSDFTAIPATPVTFLPGDTTKQFTVLVNGDTTVEPDEAFTVHLSNASGATITDADGTGTIQNDDTRPPANTVYVDDDFTGPVGSDPDSGGPATEIGYDAFATIQGGVNGVATNGTVNVAAGTYVENPAVNRAMTLLGANANTPGAGTRPAESNVHTNGNQTAVFGVTAANVTINGFLIDGDDPGVTGIALQSGDDTNASYGVRPTTAAVNNLTVSNNIIKKVEIGLRGDVASQGNTINANWFDSIGHFDFGYCVSLRNNFYANVTNNKMTRAWTGVHINNHNGAGGPASWSISGNEIHAYAGGLLYWLQFNGATSPLINSNQITAETTGAVANNFGVLFVSIQNAVNPTFTNNTISGHNYGVGLFNVPTTNTVTLGATNSVTGSTLAGVFLTDNLNFNPIGLTNFLAGGPGAASTVNVTGLAINGNTGDGIKVEGTTNAQTVNASGADITGNSGNRGVEVVAAAGHANVNGSTITGFATGVYLDNGTGGPQTSSGSFNRIVGNTTGATTNGAGTFAANWENNWWGCNAGPNNTGCAAVTGAVDFDPWLILSVTAAPASVPPGGMSSVTADFFHNSDGSLKPATATIAADTAPAVSLALPPTPVSFSATNGTVNPTSATTMNGAASTTFTATSLNAGSVTATVDNQMTSANVNVVAPDFSISDVTMTEGDSGPTSFVFTVTKTNAGAASVDFTTVDGTAQVANNDYAATNGTLNFASGDPTMTVNVQVNGDTQFEPTEAFTVHLSNAVGATISDADGTGTIQNDDPAPPPPAIVCVDDDFASLSAGDDPPGSCTEIGYDAFSTIQAGVNAVAAGGTVNVAAGNYLEDVAINNTGMKLFGAGAGVVTISGAIGGDDSTIHVLASNVTIAGFTITRDGNTVAQWNDPLNTAGIAIQGQAITGTLIRDNVLTGNRTAIDINNSNRHTVRNNTIDFNRTGLLFRNQTDQMTVVENFIRNNWTVGVLFLESSGGTNSPVQQAAGSAFSNNDISANWYAQIVDRQSGGSLPAPGTTNLKYFRGDWFGTTTPVVTTANSTEPGYAALIPVAYGGTASAPGGQPDIAGSASANFQYIPFLTNGTDTNVETAPGRGTNGFQGVENVVVIRSNNLQGWTQQHTTCGPAGTGSQAFVVGPATPPAGEGSLQYLIGANGDSFETARTADFNNVRIDALSNLSYATYVVQDGAGGQAPYLLLNIDYTGDNVLDDQLFFEPVYQSATFFPANPQGPLVVGMWQTWDALHGGWWSLNSIAGATPGTGVKTLAQYLAAQPNARVLNTGTGTGGFRIATGCGAGAWDNFIGDADNLSVGVSTTNIRYDFEPLPRLSINDVSMTEGNAGQTAYTFNVTLTPASDQTVTVDYATADDTATAPSDYTALPTTQLTFMPGETLKPVTVQVNGDFTFEPDETFFVNLSNVNANATILDGQGVGTIQNDDVPQVGISINDTFVAEPTAGASTAIFTVSLSGPSTQTVTVDYATADDTATAPGDYTALPTTQLTFTPGQTTKTVSVTVNGDALAEGNETFFVNLSNQSGNSFITDGQGQGTITDPVAAGDVLISEFRFRGPVFSAAQGIDGFRDEYVELYNNTNNPITVATTDGSAGWTLAALNSAGTGADVLVTLPTGMIIPARAHFLAVNSDEDTTTRPNANIVPSGGYSLNNYAVGDAFYVTDVSDTAGVAVFNTATVANLSAATRLDAAGFSGTAGATADLFREGAGLSSPGANDGQYAFVRHLETGLPQDSNDNAADFVFVSPTGGTFGGVQAILGAPGPENCGCYPTNPFAGSSPIQRNAAIKPGLVEPQAASTAPPNRIRDMTPVPNGSQGTLEIRRRFKNTTGQPVTRLRFRVVDVTTLNTPNLGGQQADVRWLSSTDMNVTTSLGPLTLRGITIEVPPAQTLGGGLNSSGVVNIPGGMLGVNSTIDVRFVLGVETGGRFRFFVNVEGLP